MEKLLSALLQRYKQDYMWTQALATTKEKTALGVAPTNFENMSEQLAFTGTDLDGKITIPDIGAMLGFAKGKENQFCVSCPISDILYAVIWCDEPNVKIILQSKYFTYGKGGKTNGKINIQASKRSFFKLSEDREETLSSEEGSQMQIGSEIMDGRFDMDSNNSGEVPPMEDLQGDPEKNETINQYLVDITKLPKPKFLPSSDIDIARLSISKDKTSSLPSTPEKATEPPSSNMPTQMNEKDYIDPSQNLFTDLDLAAETEDKEDEPGENEKNEENASPVYVFEDPPEDSQEMDCKVKFYEDRVILSANKTQKSIPILTKHEAEMKKLFDNKIEPTRIDREAHWETILPAFTIKQLFHPNCSRDIKKRVLENDQLYLVDMKHLWTRVQTTEIPYYWEKHCKCEFPKTLGYALFDESNTIMPFTGKISNKLLKKHIKTHDLFVKIF